MQWFLENLTPIDMIVGVITMMLFTFCWCDEIPLIEVTRKVPGAIRLVVGGLLLIGTANLVMWLPGIFTGLAGRHFFGEWGSLLVWPGLFFGFWLLKLVHKPILRVYRVISGNYD